MASDGIDQSDLCDLCKTVEADITETVWNEDHTEKVEADLCHGCHQKGLAYRDGEDVDFSDELRLAERAEEVSR